MSRLVVASNRVAVDGAQAAPGGLAIALRGLLRERGGLWFGWSGRVADAHCGALRLQTAGALRLATLDLSRSEYDGFYRGYCNAVLWPLCHGLGGAPARADVAAYRGNRAAYRSYLAANRRYAGALAPLLRRDDLVWVHDYHLIPLGRLLRRAGARAPLGFFLHVPFPEPAQLVALPQAAALMRALLGYDLLGFQARRDLEAFRAAILQWRGAGALLADGSIRCGPRRVRLAVMPVGIDVEAVRREAAAGASAAAVRRGAGTGADALEVIGVDRLDPAKGLGGRLRAYARLLDSPDIDPRRLSLRQFVTSPRGTAQDAAPLRRELAQLARRVNAHPRAAGARPLQVLHGALPHAALMVELAQARVGVVSALKDGMNLVAKEYVAAQDPSDPGVLVLSVQAGAAQQLRDAIQFDPRDPRALALAIRDALRMPLGERRRRHAAMLEVLRREDLRAWAAQLHDGLAAVRVVRPSRSAKPARPAGSRRPSTPVRAGDRRAASRASPEPAATLSPP